MRTLSCIALLLTALAACSRNATPASATSTATATQASALATTTVGGVTLQTSTVAIEDLNAAIAARYGIDRSREGVLLLVTVQAPRVTEVADGARAIRLSHLAMVDQETGLRAYLLTRDEAFLEPSRSGGEELERRFAARAGAPPRPRAAPRRFGDAPARACSNSTACSMVTASGAVPFGSDALVSPSVTYGP